MRRHIRDGSGSIAVVDNSGKTPVLRYLFDVLDTEGGADAKSPWLWEYRKEYHDAVSAALERRFGRSGEDDMAARLEEISKRLAQEFWNDHKENILDAVPGSFPDGFDELNVEVSFRRAASVSMAYALMSRCSLELKESFGCDDFLSVFDFNTATVVFALGAAVNESVGGRVGGNRESRQELRTRRRKKRGVRIDTAIKTRAIPSRNNPGHGTVIFVHFGNAESCGVSYSSFPEQTPESQSEPKSGLFALIPGRTRFPHTSGHSSASLRNPHERGAYARER